MALQLISTARPERAFPPQSLLLSAQVDVSEVNSHRLLATQLHMGHTLARVQGALSTS